MTLRRSWRRIGAAGALQLVSIAGGAQSRPASTTVSTQSSRAARAPGEGTKAIDPCTIASAEQLKQLIGGGIGTYFPSRDHNGAEWITLKNPDIRTATCPDLRVELVLDVGFDGTRGGVQFQSSGTMRIGVRMVANITYDGNSHVRSKVTADNFRRAATCFRQVEVQTLDIANAPTWLDRAFMRDRLNTALAGSACFDVTSLALFYLKGGETL
jgi:hypothetical protein